jgi:phospholipase/lecithinase/hemolysin
MPISSPYSVVYSFGDSLADAGNAWLLTNSSAASLLGQSPEPLSPPYATETYATGLSADVFSNGPTSVQDISTDLGLGTLGPSGVDVPVSTLTTVVDAVTGNAVLGAILVGVLESTFGVTSDDDVPLAKGVPAADGGTDFAIGGAVTGYTPENGIDSELTDLSTQFATFQQTVGTPLAGALYTVTIGANDLLNLLEDPNFSTYTPTQIAGDIAASVINEINFVGSLVADGAKNILVQNVPDLGLTPLIKDDYPSEVAAASQVALVYDDALSTALGTITGATITIENFYTLLDQAVADPGAFALTNVTAPVYSGSVGEDNGPVVSTDPAVQDTYLFFDDLHPTETGQTAIANLALADLGLASCFAKGTRILTPRGEMPVEALRIGDPVVAADARGTRRIEPVRWIGRRRVDLATHPDADLVAPICIGAGAIAPGLPARDLVLSPDHCVFMRGHLLRTFRLVNGVSVVRQRPRSVTYLHVELDRHALLFAEGLPAESYLDTGDRASFDNGIVVRLLPEFRADDAVMRTWEARACAPLVVPRKPVSAVGRSRYGLLPPDIGMFM